MYSISNLSHFRNGIGFKREKEKRLFLVTEWCREAFTVGPSPQKSILFVNFAFTLLWADRFFSYRSLFVDMRPRNQLTNSICPYVFPSLPLSAWQLYFSVFWTLKHYLLWNMGYLTWNVSPNVKFYFCLQFAALIDLIVDMNTGNICFTCDFHSIKHLFSIGRYW